MEPKKNTSTDSPSSKQSMKTSKLMMPRKKDTPKESITSLTGPTMNGNQSKGTKPVRRLTTTSKFYQLNQMLPQSIGETVVLSLPQRTKDHAVHAGPSPPPVLWKVLTRLPRDLLSHSQNNNWLTAQPHMETPVAMVDGWTKLSTTSRPTNLKRKPTIPTEESLEPVPTMLLRVSPTIEDSLMSRLTANLNSKPLSTKAPSQLPLKPIRQFSNPTLEELSQALLVELHLIMESS